MTMKETLTPRDWTVIRLAVDCAAMDLVRCDTDLSNADKAKLLADFKALAEKLKGYPEPADVR